MASRKPEVKGFICYVRPFGHLRKATKRFKTDEWQILEKLLSLQDGEWTGREQDGMHVHIVATSQAILMAWIAAHYMTSVCLGRLSTTWRPVIANPQMFAENI